MNKKLISSLLVSATMLMAVPAKANADVIGALIIGGIIGSAMTDKNEQPQRRPDVYMYPGTQNYPIYVPSPVYTPPRTWTPNPVYELLPVYDARCNCTVLAPVRVR
jgi:hypothetical protein